MEEQKVVQKIFRLSPEEDARLPELIQIAHGRGYISEPTFQRYMLFALNCAYAMMKDAFLQRTGKR